MQNGIKNFTKNWLQFSLYPSICQALHESDCKREQESASAKPIIYKTS